MKCHSIHYWSKIILDRPNYFARIQSVLVESNLFWQSSSHFDHVQTRLFWTIFLIWTCPKRFGPLQIPFGLMETQGIRNLILNEIDAAI